MCKIYKILSVKTRLYIFVFNKRHDMVVYLKIRYIWLLIHDGKLFK
jgi:hypothetical protein